MGLESEPVRVRASGAPSRCPFCHDVMDHEREAWLACAQCLARHHAACWSEGHGCASCGHQGSIGPSSSVEDLPFLDLEVGKRDATEPRVRVLLRGEGEPAFVVRVRNASSSPQTIELRRLPAWLRVDGASIVEVAPGEIASFRVAVVAASVGKGRDNALWMGKKESRFEDDRAAVAGTFVVSSDEEARNVRVAAFRETSRAKLITVGIFCGLQPWPLGILGLAIAVSAVFRRAHPGEDVDAAFARAIRSSDRRTAKLIVGSMVGTLAALVATLILLSRSL